MDTNFGATMFGSWKISDMASCNLPQRVASAFIGAFDGFLGASYEPVLYCGSQAVNGTNYALICKQKIPAPVAPVERVSLVIIHEDSVADETGKDTPEKKYRILSIQNILG